MGLREAGAEGKLPEDPDPELLLLASGGRSVSARSSTGDGGPWRVVVAALGRVENGIWSGRGRLADEVRSTDEGGGDFAPAAGARPWYEWVSGSEYGRA